MNAHEKLSRLQLMAAGDPKWDLSDNDRAAIQWAVTSLTNLHCADDRRLCAAVNATTGISTEALEKGALGEALEYVRSAFGTLKGECHQDAPAYALTCAHQLWCALALIEGRLEPAPFEATPTGGRGGQT